MKIEGVIEWTSKLLQQLRLVSTRPRTDNLCSAVRDTRRESVYKACLAVWSQKVSDCVQSSLFV